VQIDRILAKNEKRKKVTLKLFLIKTRKEMKNEEKNIVIT
jgi:hypothetical protein